MGISSLNVNNMMGNMDNTFNNERVIKQSEKGNELHDKVLKNDIIDKEKLDKSVKKLNRFLEDDKVHAEYSVHHDFNTIMIKIVNDKTKEVVLEIPSKKILDMVASMCKQVGLIDKKV